MGGKKRKRGSALNKIFGEENYKNMTRLGIGILSVSIFLAACEDPAANKPRATTTNSAANAPSANAPAANAQTAQGETLPITPENSKIEFVGSKVTGKHDGGFKQFSGTIDLVNNKPEESKVSIEIDMNSVFTDAEMLTEHLKTADFFDVAKYPKASFVSTKIAPDQTKGDKNYTVTGDFNLHGTTKSIAFPAKIDVDGENVEVDAEFAINRKDFGIVYAGKTDDLIRDDVVIKLDLKAPRKK
jgi:polyisoprenoid-binding protein YceI